MDHINVAFPEETRPMMYKMMKWWGGKPHNIWSEYIERYSKKNDIVLDPFCGRGVGVIESARLGRKAIGVDMNPIAIFQTKILSSKLDIDTFKLEWDKMKQILVDIEECSGLFHTKCIKCKQNARLGTMNRDNGTPYRIFYYCKCTPKKALKKEPTSEDIAVVEKSDNMEIKLPYPKDKFPKSQAFKVAIKNFGDTYDKLFTRRNLYALAVIFDQIEKIKDKDIKQFFQFAFISMIHLVTKIPSVRENSNRVMSGSWGRPGFLKMKKNMELNPFIIFERSIEGRQGVIKGKMNSNKRLKDGIKYAKEMNDLSSKNNILLLNHNTAELTNLIPENSVDYVITDPPYGGLIPYFDLSSVWSMWLKLTDTSFSMPFDDEITIDDYKDKPFDEYHRMLSLCFGEIYKVLKPGKYMTVTFHNKKPKIFNSILRACQDHGFVLEKILFQMNKRAGETGASSPWGTSVSDFYIRFFKPKEKVHTLSEYLPTKFQMIVKNEAKKIIANRGEPTEISAMIPHIYAEMGKSGMRIDFTGDKQISTILHGDSDFVEMPNKQWWLSTDALQKHRLQTPLSERVEIAVLSILQKQYKVSFDEALQSIFEQFPNSMTPNTESVNNYLKQYAKKTSDGRWKLNPGFDENTLSREHTRMEAILCKLGKRFGYKVWCPDRNKDKEMNEICEEFDLEMIHADRIKQIDVLWIRDNEVKYAFEVENSTSITSALERCSHITNMGVNKIIVIPKERETFLARKKKEPMFLDYFQKDNWKVLLYDDLENHDRGTEQALLQLAQ